MTTVVNPRNCSYVVVRDSLLKKFQDDLDRLSEEYDRKSTTNVSFATTKRQYVEYLMAYVVGSILGIKTSPPLNVETLWHIHLLETKSYRLMEGFILKYFHSRFGKEKMTGVGSHIDHSVISSQDGGRPLRLEHTQNVFTILGFDSFQSDDQIRSQMLGKVNTNRKRKFKEDDVKSTDSDVEEEEEEEEEEKEDDDCLIHFTCIVEGAQRFFFVRKRSGLFYSVRDAVAAWLGVEAHQFRMHTDDNERILEGESLAEVGVKNGDVIHVKFEQTGC
jgi:hypothetical protein